MSENRIDKPMYIFEKYICNLFKKFKFEIEYERFLIDNNNNKYIPDIILKKDEKKYCIEITFLKISEELIKKIYNRYVNVKDIILVIVTPYKIKKKYIDKNKYPKLEIIDISNLLFIVNDDEKLKNELISILPFSIKGISPEKPFIDISLSKNNNYPEDLIKKLELCKSGKKNYKNYEEICCKILKYLFSDDLTLWKEQINSNDNIYRFDLLCRVKDNNNKSFWSIIENYFKSKYIIFEFKNYTENVKQSEIYTTEKYLYSKALRTVGIIITPNGYDKNAFWAMKGSLRENGKLMLLLTNNDLLNMMKRKIDDKEDPSEYLLNKLDETLLTLEK